MASLFLPNKPPLEKDISNGLWAWLNKIRFWIQGDSDVEASTTGATVYAKLTKFYYPCNATSNPIALILPLANVCVGKRYFVKKTDASANAVVVTPSGTDTLDGVASVSLSNRFDYLVCISDGVSKWAVLSSNVTPTVSAGGSNTQIQYNNAGVLAGIPTLTYDPTRVDSTNGNPPILYVPALSPSHFVGIMQHPTFNFTGSTINEFYTPYNVKIGDSGSEIAAGSKGNFGGYEFNAYMNTNLADTNGNDGIHALGASMAMHGSSPAQIVAGVYTTDGTQGNISGANFTFTGNGTGGTQYGIRLLSDGSTTDGTCGFKIVNSTEDASARAWTEGANLGGNALGGITNIQFTASQTGVNRNYNFDGSQSDLLRIQGGGSLGSGIFYTRIGAGASGPWRFRDTSASADAVTIDPVLNKMDISVLGNNNGYYLGAVRALHNIGGATFYTTLSDPAGRAAIQAGAGGDPANYFNNTTNAFWNAAGTAEIATITAGNIKLNAAANGATVTQGTVSELITLNTGAAFTDSVANLLPANSIIDAVTARVTTTITTAVNWKLGDATTAARFMPINVGVAAGSTGVGLDSVWTGDPRQYAAAKLRITLNANPGAGVIRVTVFYRTFSAPTS